MMSSNQLLVSEEDVTMLFTAIVLDTKQRVGFIEFSVREPKENILLCVNQNQH